MGDEAAWETGKMHGGTPQVDINAFYSSPACIDNAKFAAYNATTAT
jgi:hypothetical protein